MVWNGTAVDGHKLPFPRPSLIMDRACDKFFSCTAFSPDKHRDICIFYPVDHSEHLPKTPAHPNKCCAA